MSSSSPSSSDRPRVPHSVTLQRSLDVVSGSEGPVILLGLEGLGHQTSPPS